MSFLWLRQATVSFGPKGEKGIKIKSGIARSDIIPGPGVPDISTGNARIVFNIVKNNKANKAKIQIYNLSEKSREFLNQNNTLGDIQLILEVGYKQTGLNILFVGDVERSSYKRVGADWITIIECKDGGQAIQSVVLDKSYAGDVKIDVQTIVKDLVNRMKEEARINVDNILAHIKEKVQSKKIDWGLNVEGLAMETLNTLLGAQNKEASIQNNNMFIAGPTDKETSDRAITLSPETGLIGSPITKEKDSIGFKSLIYPKVDATSTIFLKSKEFNGLYRVRSIKFNGDTHSNNWFMSGVAV